MMLSQDLAARLRACDTPTVCNAIEVAQGRRGFAGFTRATMHWSGDRHTRILGFARTAHIAGREAPSEPPDVLRARRMAYFRAMAEGPRPGVAVVEDMDGDAALGAWWGEVHAAVHGSVFGLSGAVTNGLMRDLGDLPASFPVLAGGIGPSHGFVHVHQIGEPVEIFGLRVAQGDLIHADCHGALVIPPEVLPDLGAALDKLEQSEGLVLGPIKDGPVSFEAFEAHWAAFEKART
ncbi:RraA family protein [Rhodobacteraceae bacterium N5(2021)]|uniref:RraA family protein n=1 Tax=Gymnodinialimonas phycosphaerae TaxID=2841589 RepID=A0A975YET4_9RHOB|nr:RraA family protein [Gymnodinialimonas phycosphaerae]MBY4894007.1 RraA family protein [Gymnodinialimonas phycosphaerae]